MLYPNPEDALKGLKGAALEKAYRAWAKRLHPDGTEGDHEAFLRLNKAYENAKAAADSEAEGKTAAPPGAKASPKWAEKKGGSEPRPFDPWEAVRETGRSGVLTPEDCLFASLERWRQAGSPTAKPVASASLGARNRRILRTVLHWASVVDPSLARDFALLVRYDTGPLRTTATSRADREARQRLQAGLDDLLRFRDEGRTVTAALAREKLESAREIVELHGLPRPEISRIAVWLMNQLAGVV